MLVLSRKLGERVIIGVNQDIVITVVDIDRGKIRLGIQAPRDTPIYREELLNEIRRETDATHSKKADDPQQRTSKAPVQEAGKQPAGPDTATDGKT